MRRRDQRLMMISAAGAVLVLAAALTFAGLRDSIVYFVAPSVARPVDGRPAAVTWWVDDVAMAELDRRKKRYSEGGQISRPLWPLPPLQLTTRLAGHPRLRSTMSNPASSTILPASARVMGSEPKSWADIGCSSSS